LPDVVVVGAGRSGLAAASALVADGFAVGVVERLPVAGGQEPERETRAAWAELVRSAGLAARFGSTAVAWDGGRLLTLGVDGAQRLAAAVLVVATGTRPATRGELGIAGDRCAGVVPGTAALHLVESGVLLGRRPVVYGAGTLAASCARLLGRAGADVTLLAPGANGVVPDADGIAIRTNATVTAVRGRARVTAVELTSGRGAEALPADALVLAHGRVPMRNIEGAVTDASGAVACHSGADPKSERDAAAQARAALLGAPGQREEARSWRS
jgi:pyruvate/2-oxoglutarate dehydrogenase complex dihydrolipoamide dehydrogenase (E3) component